jgi:hypothetical protein
MFHLKDAPQSLISHFLSRGHIEHRFRKENASERPQTALKTKTNRGAIENRGAIAGTMKPQRQSLNPIATRT